MVCVTDESLSVHVLGVLSQSLFRCYALQESKLGWHPLEKIELHGKMKRFISAGPDSMPERVGTLTLFFSPKAIILDLA